MKASGLATKFAKAMLSQAMAQGCEMEEICKEVGVPPEVLTDEHLRVTPEILGRLCRVTKRVMNDEFLGFTEHRCRTGSFYPFTLETMIREDTLEDALERAFTFYGLITDDIRFELSEDGDAAKVAVTLARPELDRLHYLEEWWLFIWSHVASWMIAEEIPIMSVSFTHEPSVPREEYEDAFWGPCHFNQKEGSLSFPVSYLRRRVTLRCEDIHAVFRKPYVDLAAVQGIQRSWKTLVKSKMKEYLFKTESLLSIEDLAEEFNVSSQTLRRRLEFEGISFRTLKEEVRREVILAWLAEPDIPIGEVSLRAGFAERNGLARSVRSWVGLSPSAYRQHIVGGVTETAANTSPPDLSKMMASRLDQPMAAS